jgi:hypothetical protein
MQPYEMDAFLLDGRFQFPDTGGQPDIIPFTPGRRSDIAAMGPEIPVLRYDK